MPKIKVVGIISLASRSIKIERIEDFLGITTNLLQVLILDNFRPWQLSDMPIIIGAHRKASTRKVLQPQVLIKAIIMKETSLEGAGLISLVANNQIISFSNKTNHHLFTEVGNFGKNIKKSLSNDSLLNTFR